MQYNNNPKFVQITLGIFQLLLIVIFSYRFLKFSMDKQKIIIQRNHYINNLQQFLSASKQTLQEIVHNLGWSTEKTIYKVISHRVY